jgi:hypothetical protein
MNQTGRRPVGWRRQAARNGDSVLVGVLIAAILAR